MSAPDMKQPRNRAFVALAVVVGWFVAWFELVGHFGYVNTFFWLIVATVVLWLIAVVGHVVFAIFIVPAKALAMWIWRYSDDAKRKSE